MRGKVCKLLRRKAKAEAPYIKEGIKMQTFKRKIKTVKEVLENGVLKSITQLIEVNGTIRHEPGTVRHLYKLLKKQYRDRRPLGYIVTANQTARR